MSELPGANLSAGMVWDQMEHMHSFLMSKVAEQAAELEKSVGSKNH